MVIRSDKSAFYYPIYVQVMCSVYTLSDYISLITLTVRSLQSRALSDIANYWKLPTVHFIGSKQSKSRYSNDINAARYYHWLLCRFDIYHSTRQDITYNLQHSNGINTLQNFMAHTQQYFAVWSVCSLATLHCCTYWWTDYNRVWSWRFFDVFLASTGSSFIMHFVLHWTWCGM